MRNPRVLLLVLGILLVVPTLLLHGQTGGNSTTPQTWDREVGLLIQDGRDYPVSQISVELEVPKGYALVGAARTQLTLPPTSEAQPWIRASMLPSGRTLVSLNASFAQPIQLPAYPLIMTLRMPHPDELDEPVEVNRIAVFGPSGKLIPPDDLGWDLLYQASPDGNFAPLP